MPRIAYLGPEGTFTEAALLRMATNGMVPGDGASAAGPSNLVPLPTDSTAAALAAVRSDDADYACVPIENSIEGSVLPTLDSLADRAAAADLRRAHPRRGVHDRGAARDRRRGRRTVAAFPVAAAQVRHWLAAHLPKAQLVPANSNAAAAHDVADGRADAGVSTALAAERYGLTALASDVVDEPNARTRFVLVGPPGTAARRTGADRTSVVLRLDNVPGALVSALTEFAIRDIDLTRIESRPTRTELGTYIFFLDCVGTYRGRRRRRGTQGAAPSLCRCAISGFMADGIGRRGGAAAVGRGDALAQQVRDAKPSRDEGAGLMSGRLVLVRHGQSHGNVERRLDTRPPGAELTDLGRDQARAFARGCPHHVGDGCALGGGAGRPDRRRDRRRARPGHP